MRVRGGGIKCILWRYAGNITVNISVEIFRMYLSYLSNNPTKIECGTRREMLGVYMHAYGSKTKNWGSIFFGVGSTKYLKL